MAGSFQNLLLQQHSTRSQTGAICLHSLQTAYTHALATITTCTQLTTHIPPYPTPTHTPIAAHTWCCHYHCYLQLHKLLDFKELREFATLLKIYREDLEVNDFLKKLKDLYGKQRQFLIPGKTRANYQLCYFNTFLFSILFYTFF